ncbi:MAG: hypothetical protein IJN64_19145, partial [Lachnospiraceae bacterium]|nr:hypothetical protein [Lachnospiraceae bacterium]
LCLVNGMEGDGWVNIFIGIDIFKILFVVSWEDFDTDGTKRNSLVKDTLKAMLTTKKGFYTP